MWNKTCNVLEVSFDLKRTKSGTEPEIKQKTNQWKKRRRFHDIPRARFFYNGSSSSSAIYIHIPCNLFTRDILEGIGDIFSQ